MSNSINTFNFCRALKESGQSISGFKGFIVCLFASVSMIACSGGFESSVVSDSDDQMSEGDSSNQIPEDRIPVLSTKETSTDITVTVEGDFPEYVDFYIDNELSPRLHDTSAPFVFTQSFRELSAGAHRIRVVAGIPLLGVISKISILMFLPSERVASENRYGPT